MYLYDGDILHWDKAIVIFISRDRLKQMLLFRSMRAWYDGL